MPSSEEATTTEEEVEVEEDRYGFDENDPEQLEHAEALLIGRKFLVPTNVNSRERFSIVEEKGIPRTILFDYMHQEINPPRMINTNLCLVYMSRKEFNSFSLVPLVFLPQRNIFLAHTQPEMFIPRLLDTSSINNQRTDGVLVFMFSEQHLGRLRLLDLPNLKRENLTKMPYYQVTPESQQKILRYQLDEAHCLYKTPPTSQLYVARTCVQCDKIAARCQVWKRCSACKHAYYCSTQCQEESWRMWHSRVCGITVKYEDDAYYNFT